MYFYFNIPFTSRDAFVEYPSALRGRTWIDFATHRTAPDLTGPGSVLLWAGRLRAVVSYSRQGRPHTP